MSYVELDRSFVPLRKNQAAALDLGPVWGRELGGWLNWSDLRKERRVALLAEASSGKSEEFRNQVKMLAADGQTAFYLRIEELCDQGFEAALDLGASSSFERWRAG